MADFAGVAFTALAGLAALETVADFAVLRVEGKQRFYQAADFRKRQLLSLQKHAIPV